MPIEYSLAERGNPAKPTDPKKLYAVARSQGEATVRDVAERISQMSTVSPIDVVAVIEAFFQTVPQELAAGRIVRFGDFGSFSVTLQSEGAETEKDFNAALIKTVRVQFRPGKLFDQAMQGADLRKVSTTLPATQRQAASRKKSS